MAPGILASRPQLPLWAGAILVGAVLLINAAGMWEAFMYRRRRLGAAQREAELTSRFAAVDRVRDDARRLVEDVEHAWSSRDDARLRELLALDLWQEWLEMRLDPSDCFELDGEPVCHVVDLEDDRAVVHVDMQALAVDDGYTRYGDIGERGEKSYEPIGELWTLGKRDGRWILEAIEPDETSPQAGIVAVVASSWASLPVGRRLLIAAGALAAGAALSPPVVGSGGFSSYLKQVEYVAIVVAILAGAAWRLGTLGGRARSSWRRSTDRHRQQAEIAAATSADPAFDPPRIAERATALARDVFRAHAHRDVETLRPLVDPDLLDEWARQFEARASLDADRDPQDTFDRGPEVELVRVVDHQDKHRDRAIVSIRGHLAETDTEIERDVDEHWTLARRHGGWILLAIDYRRPAALEK